MKNNIDIDSQFVSGMNDDKFIVKYNGDTNGNVDRNKLYEMIRNYKDNKKTDNMLCNVSFLKTIFRYFKENSLECEAVNGDVREYVKYFDDKLFLYEYNDSVIDFKFKGTYDIKVKTDEDYSCGLTNLFKKVFRLKYTGPVPFSSYAKELTEIYSLFYGKDPDYSSEKIMEECQLMMSFLSQFGITLYPGPFNDSDSYFHEDNKFGYPICWNLYDLVKEVYPYGLVNHHEYDTILSPNTENIIKASGSVIKENCGELYLRYLKDFSNILYKAHYHLDDDYDSEVLSYRSKTDVSDINNCKRLIKTINKTVEENESLNN